MPCHQIREVSVTFQAKNTGLLQKALEKIGCTDIQVRDSKVSFKKAYNYHEIDLVNNKIIGKNGESEKTLTDFSNSIKRAYSECVVDEIAKRQKWIQRKMGANQFQLQRF